MSDNMGVAILRTKDGNRVAWVPADMDALGDEFVDIMSEAPCFESYEAAKSYAKEVDVANRTEYGIMVINCFRDIHFDDL